MKRECLILCLGVLFSCCSRAEATPAPAKQRVSQESLIGDTQRKLLPSTPPVLSPQPEQNAQADIFISESPCWMIDKVETATAPLRLTAFKQLAHTARGRCMGDKGLARLRKKLQNALIAQGYITSRVQLDVQEVPAGILKVRVHYGRIGQLKMQAGSSAYFRPDALFPIAAGDVLNLRSIEQGLENMGGYRASSAISALLRANELAKAISRSCANRINIGVLPPGRMTPAFVLRGVIRPAARCISII